MIRTESSLTDVCPWPFLAVSPAPLTSRGSFFWDTALYLHFNDEEYRVKIVFPSRTALSYLEYGNQ